MKTEAVKIKLLNPKKEPLSIELFKKMTNNEDLSDEEAEQSVLAIRALVGIIMEIEQKEEVTINNEAA